MRPSEEMLLARINALTGTARESAEERLAIAICDGKETEWEAYRLALMSAGAWDVTWDQGEM